MVYNGLESASGHGPMLGPLVVANETKARMAVLLSLNTGQNYF